MKKRMSKILSMLLISALVVSAGSVVEAADMEGQTAQVQEADGEAAPAEDEAEAVPAEEVKEEVPAAVEEKAEVEKAEAPVKEAEEAPEIDVDVLSAGGSELGAIEGVDVSGELDAQYITSKDIPVKTAVTGDETIVASEMAAINYTQDDVKGEKNCGYSQPYNAPAKGILSIGALVASGERTVYYGVFKDAEMTQVVADAVDYVTTSDTEGRRKNFRIPAAGTYYIGVYSTNSSISPVNQIVGVEGIFYNGGDRTISNGQMVVVGQKDAQTNYFKYKAIKTGYLRVEGDTSSSRVAICNSSKKALSGDTYFRQFPTYGVTKGKTYYIRIQSGSSSLGYRFKINNAGISEKSGKSRAKAVNVKRGKTVKGTIQAGSSQADWYKFKLTGKKKVTINLTTGSNDALKVIVYKGGKQVGNGSRTIYNNATGRLYSTTKWSKGTYYIKVQRANKNSSGYYTLKWK